MKKRILGIMLTICMLLSALPLTSIVATAAENVSTQSVASATGAEVVSVKVSGTANGGFNKYAVKVSGTASQIQVIFPNANTYTFNRSGSEAKNDNSKGVVSIKAYDKDNNEVALGSKSTAYELWVINMALKEGTYTVRAKYNNTWEAKGKTVTVSYSVKVPEEVKVTKADGKDGSYSFKVNGTAQKLRIIHSNGLTNTFTKSNSSVNVKYYNSESVEVDKYSGEVAYEVWTISKKYNDGKYTAIAKYHNGTTYVWGTTALAFDITDGEVEITLDSDKINALSAFTYEKSSDGKVKITGVKDTSITEIVVPDFVYEIACGAFKDCKSLEKLTVPYVGNRSNGEYYSIGYAFGAKSYKENGSALPETLKEITVTGGYSKDEKLQTYAFYDCANLTNIIIGDGIKFIERAIFYDCESLKSLTVPFVGYCENQDTDVVEFPFSWFWGNSSNCLDTMGKCSGICYRMFSETWADGDRSFFITGYIPNSLETVTVSGGKIGRGCFSYIGSLKKVVLGSGVTSIGCYAFQNCSSLEDVEIPSSLLIIEDSAFYGTPFLKELENEAEASDGFIYINNVLLKYVGTDRNITIKEGIVSIAGGAFYTEKTSLLESVTFPSTLRYLGSEKDNYGGGVFAFCSNLKTVIMNDGLETICAGAFFNCTNLSNITFPENESIRFIGMRAFDGTKWYNELPEGENYIGKVFYRYKVTDTLNEPTVVTVKDGTVGIASCAFSNAMLRDTSNPTPYYNLVGVNLPDSITWIGENAFSHAVDLESITLPKNLTQIGFSAFEYCTSLRNITIPKGVKTLPYHIFKGCNNITIRFEEGSQLKVLCRQSLIVGDDDGDNVIYLPEGVQYIHTTTVNVKVVVSNINQFIYTGDPNINITIFAEENADVSTLENLETVTIYRYSETEPYVDGFTDNYNGNYWYYDENGIPTVWE